MSSSSIRVWPPDGKELKDVFGRPGALDGVESAQENLAVHGAGARQQI